MADAIDWADDCIAAGHQFLDPVRIVLDATIVVQDVCCMTACDFAQMGQDTCAPTQIEDSALPRCGLAAERRLIRGFVSLSRVDSRSKRRSVTELFDGALRRSRTRPCDQKCPFTLLEALFDAQLRDLIWRVHPRIWRAW